jgi:hypothetical protein
MKKMTISLKNLGSYPAAKGRLSYRNEDLKD